MARVMENHSQYLLPIPDVTSTTTRGFATQVVQLLRFERVESLHLVFGRGPFSDGCRGGRPWLRASLARPVRS